MGSIAHVEEERKDLVKDVHMLTRLGVRLISLSNYSVIVRNGAKSSLVVKAKESNSLIQSCLNLRVQSTINEWRFSPKGEIVYFATKVRCVFQMRVS